MKRLAILSLLLNAALLALALARVRPEPVVPSTLPASLHRPAVPVPPPARAAAPLPLPTAAPVKPWDAIASDDAGRFVANLRAVGCPEQTVRDIVTLRVCRAWHARLMQYWAEADGAWDFTRNRSAAEAGDLINSYDRLRDGMRSELESLLGERAEGLAAAVLGVPPRGSLPDYLPLEKRALLRQTETRFGRLAREAGLRLPWNEGDPDSRVRRLELERQKLTELSALLTPQELQEYQMRESRFASYVRNRAPAAKSEAEFRTMVSLAIEMGMDAALTPFAARYGLPPRNAAEAAEAEREAAYQRRLKELLGQ